MGNTGIELDPHVAYSSVPQNPEEQQKDELLQTGLWVLLSVVLYGIAAQAFFINLLYHESAVSGLTLVNNTSAQDGPICGLPSKPESSWYCGFAHLKDGSLQENKVMLYRLNNATVLSGMDYKDGKLEVQKEGFYYVYSKVCFSHSGGFHHCVMNYSHQYGINYTLMQSWEQLLENTMSSTTNFLGGMFHFHKGDRIFVRVRTTSTIIQDCVYENFFGAFMV